MKKKIKPKVVEYNPANKLHGYENVRWVENVSCGLRLVGFADKIAHLNHEGWWTRDDGDNNDEVYRGVVYQLPARNRTELYVFGYADPNNDGCALLCFGDITDDKEQAARNADRFAEIVAEHERDYHRAWDAGRRYEYLADKIKDLRKEALTISTEMRAARKAQVIAPTICATLRGQIMSLYLRIQHARKTRAELLADFGRCEGFTE